MARQASRPRRMPAWDLFLVLQYLRSDVFSPLRETSLLMLTLKTAFLVSLATAHRSSEIHALSGMPADICFERDGSVSLRYLPEFLAKTQRSCDHSPATILRPLDSIVSRDEPELDLCPVRALREYLRRTQPIRDPACRRLFISVNPNFPSDIRKGTVARWLSSVIAKAYKQALLQAPSVRAHEIRALATSLAAAHNVSLHHIMESASWRSSDCFISCYLRDISRLGEDGSHGISAAVVAGFSVASATASSN